MECPERGMWSSYRLGKHREIRISHPEVVDYEQEGWAMGRLIVWGFSGKSSVWCSALSDALTSSIVDVVQVNLETCKKKLHVKTIHPVQAPTSPLQKLFICDPDYLVNACSDSEKTLVQYYSIQNGGTFHELVLADKLGRVNQCWLDQKTLITAVKHTFELHENPPVFSSDLYVTHMEEQRPFSISVDNIIIDSAAMLPDGNLAFSSEGYVRVIDTDTGDLIHRFEALSIIGSVSNRILVKKMHEVALLDPKSFDKFWSSEVDIIGKAQQLDETNICFFERVADCALMWRQKPFRFTSVKTPSDTNPEAQILMSTERFDVPSPEQTILDMKWGRLAYMDKSNLQLVIRDFKNNKGSIEIQF